MKVIFVAFLNEVFLFKEKQIALVLIITFTGSPLSYRLTLKLSTGFVSSASSVQRVPGLRSPMGLGLIKPNPCKEEYLQLLCI